MDPSKAVITEYATKVFTMRPDNYDADAAAMAAWLTKRSADGWTATNMTHEIMPDGVIISLALAIRARAEPQPPAKETADARSNADRLNE